MGLFDLVEFKTKLPLPEDKSLLDEFEDEPIEKLVTFQTKDLGRTMSSYAVYYDRTICKKEAANYEDGVFDEDGYIKTPTYTPITVPDMTMRVYELYSPMDHEFKYNTTKFDYWIEYELTIENSLMKDIKLKKFEKRERTELNLDKIFECKDSPSYKFKKFIRKIFGVLQKGLNWLDVK